MGGSTAALVATDDLDRLWLAALEAVIGRAAHEVKDALNGVSVNVEVIRSRAVARTAGRDGVQAFAEAAAEQMELLTARSEAVLFLARPARDPGDVSVTLRHLAALLVPAARADGGSLTVDGADSSAPTAAPGRVTRLALAEGMLACLRVGGSSRCRVLSGAAPVVQFSHESAAAGSIDPAVVSVIAGYGIRYERSENDLRLVFPGDPVSHST